MRCLLPLLILAAPAQAESALEWLTTNAAPSVVKEAGTWATPSGTVFAVDPLTLYGRDSPISGLPTTAARVFGFYPLEDPGRNGLMALIWSDAPILCGDDVTTIGVDTGLAAFLTQTDLDALARFEAAHRDLYDGSYAQQIDGNYPGPTLIDLPGATGFPLSGSGWGDGGYPVATLKDANGDVTAIYTQFIPAEGADWLLPAPCTTETH